MSSCTTTVPNSVRNTEPVGHTSGEAPSVQCLHTSGAIRPRRSLAGGPLPPPGHARRHQPPQLAGGRHLLPAGPVTTGPDHLGAEGFALLDEGHVPPRIGTQALGVVVRPAAEVEAVVGDVVPLLARHLARLAADA